MSLTTKVRQSDVPLRHMHSIKHALTQLEHRRGGESFNSSMIFDRFVVSGSAERKYGTMTNSSIIMKTLTPVLNSCVIKRQGLMSDVC